jgi:hypothetical protein
MGAKMLQRPAESYLRQQAPEVYGALSGLMGTAPDEQGSVLDPNTARARAGAEIGFPLGTALQMLPLFGPAKTGAMAIGRAGERFAERAVPQIMERGGMGAEMLQGMSRGTVSPMQLFDTTGLPNKGRDLIQSKAESLANQLRENGFNVDLQHSGSLAGPSSYLKIFDPQTGRSFTKDVRISGHSKGPFNTQSVLNVASDQELNNVISSAINMRETGVSKGMRQITDLENKAQEFIADGMKPKTAYKKARDFLDNQNNNQPVQQNNINSFIQ